MGGLYTMGPEDALAAVKLLEPEIVIPMHFGTFAAIAQDVHAFQQRVEKETNSRCLVMERGQENSI
jgi:L-ascorbate metabolism protein UlaG (beta-lactamase superfamily)